MPKFSIIMPAFNAEKTILQAISSVLRQLLPEDELIVIDDASTDKTQCLVADIQDHRIKLLVHEHNQGISGARNTALEVVTGDYVAFMDADDLWPEGRQEILKHEINHCHPDIISGVVEHFYCPSLNAEEAKKFKLPETQHASIPGSMVFAKTCVDYAGLFDTRLKVGEFIDYVSRIKQQERNHIKIDAVVLNRRIHGENHTLKNREKQSDYLAVIRRHLERV